MCVDFIMFERLEMEVKKAVQRRHASWTLAKGETAPERRGEWVFFKGSRLADGRERKDWRGVRSLKV